MPFLRLQSSAVKLSELILTIVLCCVVGLAIVLAGDLPPAFAVALAAAFFCGLIFILIPDKKEALVMGWFLVHPLSIEKVFPVGVPLLPDFIPPLLVISGSDIILFLLLLLLLYEQFILQRPRVWSFPQPLTPLLFFLLWNAILLFRQPLTPEGVLSLIHVAKMILFIFIMVSAVTGADSYKKILQAMAWAVAVQVAIVFYTSFSGNIIRFSHKITSSVMTFSGIGAGSAHVRATGTMGHVNQEASFLTFSGLCLVGLPWIQRRVRRLFTWIVLSGAAGAVFLTYSRTAWLAVFVAIAAMIVLSLYYHLVSMKSWIYVFPAVVVGILIAPMVLQPAVDRIFYGDEGATSSRIRAMRLSLDLLRPHPFIGVGPGRFARASLERYPPGKSNIALRPASDPGNETGHRFGRLEVSQVQLGNKLLAFPLPVHNKYLLILTELGFVGLFLFLWFQWRVYRQLLQLSRHLHGRAAWPAMGLHGAFWASQVFMMLDLFQDDKTMQILLTVPILVMALHKVTVRN